MLIKYSTYTESCICMLFHFCRCRLISCLFHTYMLRLLFTQVHLTHDDINKVQLELVPMLQEIIFEWLIIIFFTITPSSLAVTEDFNSKLSSLQIGVFLLTLYHGSSNLARLAWIYHCQGMQARNIFPLLNSGRNK